MSIETSERWHEGNQRKLMAALAAVRAQLQRARNQAVEAPATTLPESRPSFGSAAVPPPAGRGGFALETLCLTFDLTAFERDVLLLCAGMELDGDFAGLCAAAGDSRRPYPSFGLALATLRGAHWSALSPDAPLRRWRMIRVGEREPLTLAPLRIDERILHHLTGVPCMEPGLRALVTPIATVDPLPASHAEIAARIAEVWSKPGAAASLPLIQLCGPDVWVARGVAVAALERLEMRAYSLPSRELPVAPERRESLARLWEREAALLGGALLFECGGLSEDERDRAASFLQRLQGMVLVSAPEPLPITGRPTLRLDLKPPDAIEQRSLWRSSLGSLAAGAGDRVDSLAEEFHLSPHQVRAACDEVRMRMARAEDLEAALWTACRGQARLRMDDLAQRIEPAARPEDLVLPEPQWEILRQIGAQVRHRARVYRSWGFARSSSRGLGISALFAGASSGVGKTLAAEVLAAQLELDLYRIDLSAVVSKYIGETEKNLRRLFDAAESGGGILLFDEADALFGKRSEVKDSHDRYANIEVSYLLQRMETFGATTGRGGLAILTTNLRSSLDPAFMRRLRFVVDFPFPNARLRAAIWRRAFPPDTPTQGLDVDKLAQLNVAGGNIRNIAMNAAFLAADEDAPVSMRHILSAAHTEYAKLEKSLTDTEIRGWHG